MRTTVFALGALATISAAASAHASPQDLFGFGGRASAMAGLGASFIDDYAATHANPAGLSRARISSVTLGYTGAAFALSARRGDEPDRSLPVGRTAGSTVGLTLPLPLGGRMRDRVALGLGFYSPTDVIVRARIAHPEVPQFVVLADRAQSVALQVGLGVDVGHGLRVGAGISALAAVRGSVAIAPDVSGRVASRVDNQLVASYAPILGASWDRGPWRLAAVFRGTLEGRFGVRIEARDIGIPLPRFNIAGIAQYDPWQAAVEAAWAPRDVVVAVGATFKRWSEYPGPLERTTPTSPAPPAAGFADTVVLRAAAERTLRLGRGVVAVRGGYFFEPTPAPLATGSANYLDNDRHVFTAGVALAGRLRGSTLRTEIFAQAHALARRMATKGGDVPADNPGAPTITHGGAVYVLGVTGTVTF